MQRPTIGRIIHVGVIDLRGRLAAWPGIITEVHEDESIGVTVFPPQLPPIPSMIPIYHSEELKSGCWSWPARS